MWSGSPAKRGSLDNYHRGISQPCSISCYFWAIPFEVSLCFIWLSLNTAGRLGQARQLSRLTCRPFKRRRLSQPLTTLPPSLAGLHWYPLRGLMMISFSFFFLFFWLRTSRLPLFYCHRVCVAFTLRCVREILDYSNHSNQCLLFNAEFPE